MEAPGAELGATPLSGLLAYELGESGWILLPSWVDRELGELHVLVPGNRVVAIAAVTPRVTTLTPGWNLVTFTGAPATPVSILFGGVDVTVDAVHRWNSAAGRFDSAFPLAPSFSTLSTVQPRDALWVHVRGEASVDWAIFGGALPGLPRPLEPGWNLVSWVGATTNFTTAAIPLFGLAPAVFRWNATDELYEVFNAGGPAFFNTLLEIGALDGLWVFLATDGPVAWPQPGLGPAVPGS